ncbi:MAG: DUF6273 domain-containing protein [Coriobacteriales bacterium]|jgi:tetratricopeptide (TPR) repeat protein|nr:DUF6273 domain-containing protein [Coriobacteriales bacterium]
MEAPTGAALNISRGIITADALVKHIRLFCKNGNFNKAREMIEQGLAADPKNAELYLVALMIEREVRSESDLGRWDIPDIEDSENYEKSYRFGDAALKTKLKKYRASNEGNDYYWQTLFTDKTNRRALIITRDCVIKMPYHRPGGSITWADCTLRRWLNNEFYNSLSESIKDRIIEVTNQNPNSASHGTPGGVPSRDKVFLLSIDEVVKYFASDRERIAKYEGRDHWWWLRSPGRFTGCAADVGFRGTVLSYGDFVDGSDRGIRPVFWLNL